jgi:hypothetical protein
VSDSGDLWIYGGVEEDLATPNQYVWQLSANSSSWTRYNYTKPTVPPVFVGHAMWLENSVDGKEVEKVWVFGGSSALNQTSVAESNLWVYLLPNKSWLQVGNQSVSVNYPAGMLLVCSRFVNNLRYLILTAIFSTFFV